MLLNLIVIDAVARNYPQAQVVRVHSVDVDEFVSHVRASVLMRPTPDEEIRITIHCGGLP